MPRLRSRYFQPIIHVVAWLCLFFYPFLFHYVHLTDKLALFRIAAQLLLVIAFFYANLHIFIPRLLGKKYFILYFLCAGISIAIVGYGSGYIEFFFNQDFANKHDSISVARTTGVIISFLAWVISSGLKITSEWFNSERNKSIAEKEKLQSELLFLKNQVNPHFLFNALNNIYSLEQLISPNTGEAILKLSELMRYTLYETAAAVVPLEKEVAYLRNYVELQKMGISDEVTI
ncbi:MAG TPA: histidine kinase, partial [Bacteroidia bacterium]|nr:histidine kinase [Bacteroidia bacterium]